MGKDNFCECSEKGKYSLGVTQLANGKLSCNNCRGIVDPTTFKNKPVREPEIVDPKIVTPQVRRQVGGAKGVAIQSAKIVNAYGTVIQVIGIAVGVVIGASSLALGAKYGSGVIAIVGIVIAALDIAIFAVQGALFRMISNYVIARLEENA